MQAVKGGGAEMGVDVECVRAILAADDVDVNRADNEGQTALMIAATYGLRTPVRMFLTAGNGVNVNHANAKGQTVLDLVVRWHDESAADVSALATAKGINLDHRDDQGWTALHTAVNSAVTRSYRSTNVEAASILLVAGSCRFALESAPQTSRKTPQDLAGDNKEMRALFSSGIDYWQRKHHGGHSWAMKQVVRAVQLVRQRLDAPPRTSARADTATATATATATDTHTDTAAVGVVPALVHLPDEIWLVMCGFLRSADFPPV